MWFKVDDGFAAHRKVEQLQGMPVATYTAAITIWTLMGSDCGCHLTDGKFTRLRVRKVTGLPDKVLDAGLAALVKVGLFDMVDGECAFHDWASMQPTKAEVDARRAAKAAAGKLGGQASGEVRSKQVLPKNEAGASPDGKQEASTTHPVGEPSRAVPPSGPVRSGPVRSGPDRKEPPPTPSGREASTPAGKPAPVEGDEPPPAMTGTDPVVVVHPQASEPPKGLRLAYSAPSDGDTDEPEPSDEDQRAEALVFRIAMVPGARFNPNAASREERYAVGRILLAEGATEDLCVVMGELLRDPPKVWPWATQLNRGNFTRVSCAWLMGSKGGKVGHALCQLIDAGRDALASRRQRAEASATPRPAATPELSAAAKAAAMERIRARRAEAPGPVSALPSATPAEVTHG